MGALRTWSGWKHRSHKLVFLCAVGLSPGASPVFARVFAGDGSRTMIAVGRGLVARSECPVRMYLSAEASVRIAVRMAAVQRSIVVRMPAFGLYVCT